MSVPAARLRRGNLGGNIGIRDGGRPNTAVSFCISTQFAFVCASLPNFMRLVEGLNLNRRDSWINIIQFP